MFVPQGNGFDGIQACRKRIPYLKYRDQEFQVQDLMPGFAPLEPDKDRITDNKSGLL